MTAETPIWSPSMERVHRSQMDAFMRDVADRYGVACDFESVRRWSVEHPESFWRDMLRSSGVVADGAADEVVSGESMRDARWFPGLRLNYAEHMLRFNDDRVAIHFECESGDPRRITYAELNVLVARCASALRRAGVRQGDRVAGFVPNIPEALVAMLAATSLGAIWSSCSPDFGLNGVLDRFGQIEPTVLVTADGYSYNGKPIDSLERVASVCAKLPSLRRVVVVPFQDPSPDLSGLRRAVLWGDFLDGDVHVPLTFERLPFDHPLFIMYSSGTTGTPKCIVHGHGGTLLQHAKEHMLHCDLRRHDVIFYFTTCGWMMWNWLVSALGTGATVVLYEGSPTYPRITRLWSLVEQASVSVFGTSPKFLAACQKSDLRPREKSDLGSLRCLLSTGSPMSADLFEWTYRHVKGDLQLSSICGGTDIISCFMLGNPVLPVYAGEIQCRGLGMDVHAYSADGQSVVGEKGELICGKSFPSRPIHFWNDPDGEKYRKAYFDKFDGVWTHGDLIEITEHGGVVVYGRSDATLNPGGVRIGTAEIYRVVEAMEEIADSIAVAKRVDDDDEVCLFVVLRDGVSLTSAVADRIKGAIAEGATRRHVPKHIRQVSAIPHTISGKKVELAVAQVIRGETVKNLDALANPEALDQFRDIL